MAAANPKDACDLLDADHRAVKKLFKQYDELSGTRTKTALAKKLELAGQICSELKIHTTIEEEIFYPAAREAIKDTAILDEADVEHASAKQLIADIEASTPSDQHYDAKVKVLGEYIDHHVKEERNELFPKARAAKKLDLVAMRDALEQRKAALSADAPVAV